MIRKSVNSKKIGWIIVFAMLFFFWIFQVKKKEDMHCDEYFSYIGANSDFQNEGFAFADLEDGQWITPAYFAGKYSVDEEELFNYHAVWKNQRMDVHPPLYYMVHHFACSFFLGEFSMKPGLLINIVCMAFLLVVIYKTLYLLSDNQTMSLIAVVAYGACPGVLSTIVFIRMYALTALFVGLMVYLYAALVCEKIKNKTFLIGIFGVNLLGGLTHYYFLVFSVITFALYVLWQIYLIIFEKQEIHSTIAYILTNAASAVIYLLIWPSCIEHILHGYRGEETFENAAKIDSFLENISKMFKHPNAGFWLNNGKLILILICIIAIGLYLKGYWTKSLGLALAVGINATIYYLLVSQISPFKAERYLMPMYPLIAVVSFTFLIICLNHFCKGIKVFFILITLFVFAQILHEPNYLYVDKRERVRQVTSQESENGLFIRKDYDWYHLASDSLYFTCIKNLKVVFDMENTELIDMDERLQNLSSVCVFFDSDFSEKDMTEYFGDRLWGGQYIYTFLDSADYCDIYLFERTEI